MVLRPRSPFKTGVKGQESNNLQSDLHLTDVNNRRRHQDQR